MKDTAFVILNQRYEDPAIVSLTSFFRFNRHIPLICYLEKGGDFGRLRQALSGYPVRFEEIVFPEEQIFRTCGGDWLLINRSALPAISARVRVLEELASKYDRIVNFDLDTLFCNSIAGVMNVADAAHVYGVDEKENRKRWMAAFGLKEWIHGEFYFNTGFAVYGGRLLRNRPLYDDYIRMMEAHPERFNCPEQDYLNCVFHNDLVRIRPSYNMLFQDRAYTETAPVMIHFYGPDKPWSPEGVFAGKTGFYNRRYANYVSSIRNMLSDEFVRIVTGNAGKGGVLV